VSDFSKWLGLSSFGAINRCFTANGKTSNEWHYYISSRKLTAEELLKTALNYVRHYKNETKVKTPMSKLMFACLLNCDKILEIINFQ